MAIKFRWQNVTKTIQVVHDIQGNPLSVGPGGIISAMNEDEEKYYQQRLGKNPFFAPAGPPPRKVGLGKSDTKQEEKSVSGGEAKQSGQNETLKAESTEDQKASEPEQSSSPLKELETVRSENTLPATAQRPAGAKVAIETGRPRRKRVIERETVDEKPPAPQIENTEEEKTEGEAESE